jgi:hypothetical protein
MIYGRYDMIDERTPPRYESYECAASWKGFFSLEPFGDDCLLYARDKLGVCWFCVLIFGPGCVCGVFVDTFAGLGWGI